MKVTNLYPELLELEREVNAFLAEWNDKSPYIRVQTSGSTGNPKTITVSKDRMRVSAKMTGSFFGFRKGQKALLCLSPKYIAGKMMVVRAIEFELELLLGKIESVPYNGEVEVDFAAMVPMQVEKSLEKNVPLNQVGHLIIGGAPISKRLKEKLLQVDSNIYATFGMTETLSHIALAKLSGNEFRYRCLPGVRISTNNNSCLRIECASLLEEPIQTNDIVEIFNEKEFEWRGRADFVINSGGIKIHPEEIEFQLKGVLDCDLMVFGEPDEVLGSRLALILESKDTVDCELAFSKLGKFQVPKKVYAVREFSRTKTGKINRLKTIEKCL